MGWVFVSELWCKPLCGATAPKAVREEACRLLCFVPIDGTSGRYCREFQQSVVIGGQSEQAYGIACQQPDGSWEVKQ